MSPSVKLAKSNQYKNNRKNGVERNSQKEAEVKKQFDASQDLAKKYTVRQQFDESKTEKPAIKKIGNDRSKLKKLDLTRQAQEAERARQEAETNVKNAVAKISSKINNDDKKASKISTETIDPVAAISFQKSENSTGYRLTERNKLDKIAKDLEINFSGANVEKIHQIALRNIKNGGDLNQGSEEYKRSLQQYRQRLKDFIDKAKQTCGSCSEVYVRDVVEPSIYMPYSKDPYSATPEYTENEVRTLLEADLEKNGTKYWKGEQSSANGISRLGKAGVDAYLAENTGSWFLTQPLYALKRGLAISDEDVINNAAAKALGIAEKKTEEDLKQVWNEAFDQSSFKYQTPSQIITRGRIEIYPR
ncbi:MAG: hypothetical protein V4691_06595 [Pseudomonadota bacterium]